MMTANSDAGASTRSLLLVPTERERDCAAKYLTQQMDIHVCGFGPVVAGIETARLLAGEGFDRVILFGIAGTYDAARLPPGTACSFRTVACYGIGAGEHDDYQSAAELGLAGEDESGPLPLHPVEPVHELLLTVTSAAARDFHVKMRRLRFPQAMAEDMEAWAVALAAARADCPLTVIRGISNLAGDRDHSSWDIESAMKSAVQLLKTSLSTEQRE